MPEAVYGLPAKPSLLGYPQAVGSALSTSVTCTYRPQPGDVLVLVHSDNSGGNSIYTSVSGMGLTWALAGSTGLGSGNTVWVDMWYAIVPAFFSPTSYTVSGSGGSPRNMTTALFLIPGVTPPNGTATSRRTILRDVQTSVGTGTTLTLTPARSGLVALLFGYTRGSTISPNTNTSWTRFATTFQDSNGFVAWRKPLGDAPAATITGASDNVAGILAYFG